jgi:hypothetical protein
MSQHTERTRTWGALGGSTAAPISGLDRQSFNGLQNQVRSKSYPATGRSSFANYAALYFPEVAALMDESDFGVLHLEVGVLKLATRDAIAERDWHTVCKYFAFVAYLFEDAGPDLRDAINISYLGNLFYGETSLNYAKARTLLPKPLVRALEAIETHYEHLAP